MLQCKDNRDELMKKKADDIDLAILIKEYLETNSFYKVATEFDVSASAVKRILKNAGVLRTQKQAAIEHKNKIRQSKHGKNIRRPRDFKHHQFRPFKNECFTRDNYTCQVCSQKGRLHAHHKIPYWVAPQAFFDVDNLVTVCTECHLHVAHNNNWATFNVSFIDKSLIYKYSLDVDRLNVLATFYSRCDSQGTDTIHKSVK